MNELQLTVTVAAGVAIAVVLFFNFRDFRRIRKASREAPLAPQSEEPIFKGLAQEGPDSPGLPSEISESIATLKWSIPLSVDRIYAAIRGWRRVGSKPIFFGWADEEGTLYADPPAAEANRLTVGVLLATRSGPLHAMEYSEWQDQLDRIAKMLGAQLDIPSMGDVLAKARMLDQKCAAIDAQLTLCVKTDSVLSVDLIQSACVQCGLTSRGESRYAEIDGQGRVGFTVFPGDHGDTLTLMLDVPRTYEPTQAFDRMCSVALKLSQILSGQLTDEAMRVLREESISVIRSQVVDKEEGLIAAGITPGSAVALRLFL